MTPVIAGTSNHLYPTSDGRPMAETDWHRKLMTILIQILETRYAADPDAYVSGNLLVFLDRRDKRRHISPDCFVVFGVPKRDRPNYLPWEEGKGPDVVIEVTSKTTRREDTTVKFERYRDLLKVKEYFLFDPFEDYLSPSMRGYRLRAGQYVPIRFRDGRLPSARLGLHLERDGQLLRFWNPDSAAWLPTPDEVLQGRDEEIRARAEELETERERVRAERERARVERERADALEAELGRLRKRLHSPANGKGNGNGIAH